MSLVHGRPLVTRAHLAKNKACCCAYFRAKSVTNSLLDMPVPSCQDDLELCNALCYVSAWLARQQRKTTLKVFVLVPLHLSQVTMSVIRTQATSHAAMQPALRPTSCVFVLLRTLPSTAHAARCRLHNMSWVGGCMGIRTFAKGLPPCPKP